MFLMLLVWASRIPFAAGGVGLSLPLRGLPGSSQRASSLVLEGNDDAALLTIDPEDDSHQDFGRDGGLWSDFDVAQKDAYLKRVGERTEVNKTLPAVNETGTFPEDATTKAPLVED